MTTVEILKSKGPLISSELAKELQLATGMPYNTASQKLVRDKSILKIKGFFISNQAFCYLPEHKNDDLILDNITKAMFQYGRKYWYCLNAIRLHGGMIHRKYLECYTNYPVLPLKSHLPFKEVMQKFVFEGILVFNGDYYAFSPKISKAIPNPILNKTIDAIKDQVLVDFHSLTRNTGLISFNSGKFFEEFGKFSWGFQGASYVSGVKQNTKPGFLLADILLGLPFYKEDTGFFIDKLKHIQSFKNAPRIIPFLLIDDLEPEAFNDLKKEGIVVGFIKEFFGQKYAETLKSLVNILNNAGASLKTPDKYLDLISELKKYNMGLANNIKGALFEFVVGHIHSIKSSSSIDLGWEVVIDNERHEIDVKANYSNKIVIAECKATNQKIDIDYIDKWLTIKIPAFKKWFQKQEIWQKKALDLEFEFWSASGFTDGAINKLNNYIKSAQKTKISYFQPNEIRNEAKALKNKKLKELLDNFFLKTKV